MKTSISDIATLVFFVAVCCALAVFVAISVEQGKALDRAYERLGQVERYEVIRAINTDPKILVIHDHKEETQWFYVAKTDGDLFIIEEGE